MKPAGRPDPEILAGEPNFTVSRHSRAVWWNPRVATAETASGEGEQRVTPLELFFDLVFVLSFTQVTASIADDPTWEGLGEGLLILAAVWWAWAAYGWLTNAIDADENLNRLAMFAAMGAMLIVSLASRRRSGTWACCSAAPTSSCARCT